MNRADFHPPRGLEVEILMGKQKYKCLRFSRDRVHDSTSFFL